MNSETKLINRITLYKGDITKQQDVDAIVCTIHADLTLRGSLVQSVFKAAGPRLDDDMLEHIVKPHPGDVFTLSGYDLQIPHIIFAVLPIWYDGFDREDAYLRRCFRKTMMTAREMGLARIAYPALGTGSLGYPLERAIRIGVTGIKDRLAGGPDEVRIVCNRDDTFNGYGKRLQKAGWDSKGRVKK